MHVPTSNNVTSYKSIMTQGTAGVSFKGERDETSHADAVPSNERSTDDATANTGTATNGGRRDHRDDACNDESRCGGGE